MLAAGGRLFIVTVEGDILCFAGSKSGEAKVHTTSNIPFSAADSWTGKASRILEATGVHSGYALCLGIERGRLIEELLRQSKLHVIALDEDQNKVSALRHRLYRLGE